MEPRERTSKINVAYPPSFYMHLNDPHAHWEMIEALRAGTWSKNAASRPSSAPYRVTGFMPGKVAEKIEVQTHYATDLYYVNVRQDQRYLAEHDLFPCGDKDESRFSPDFEVPLIGLGMEVIGDPTLPKDISCVQILDGHKRRFEGPERVILSDLMEFIKVHDPDVILFPYADTWVPLIVKKARRYGLKTTFSRSGHFKSMASKSYWSYGEVNHKDRALIPDGRVLIDTAKSFVYNEGGSRAF